MPHLAPQSTILSAWEDGTQLTGQTRGPVRDAVAEVIEGLDNGTLRVAESSEGGWTVHEWIKKAILLSFRLSDSAPLAGGYDKVPLKWAGWDTARFAEAGFRAVPGSIVRRGAFIGKGAVIMPSFVNIGAHVGGGTMIDSGATVGSCAQIGADCHISSGVVIGGVLEPLQASPVVVEEGCFVGANSSLTEGVVVGTGAVIASGVQIGGATRIVERDSGAVSYGLVPAGAVVVAGMMPGKNGVALSCAVIVKRVDVGTRAKTSINDLLRD